MTVQRTPFKLFEKLRFARKAEAMSTRSPTLRDEFAMRAMSALIISDAADSSHALAAAFVDARPLGLNVGSLDHLAHAAYAAADAMLRARAGVAP